MENTQANIALHGITLKALLEELVAKHGWPGLADHIDIRCFKDNPSLKSSLKFLRKTPWARAKVERLFLADKRKVERNRKRKARRAQAAEAALEEVAKEGSEP